MFQRASIFEALSKVQAPQEVLSQLTPISVAQTKGHKRRLNDSIDINTADDKNKSTVINIIAGSRKRRKLLAGQIAENMKDKVSTDPNIVGFEVI